MHHLTCILSIISNKSVVWREESEMKGGFEFICSELRLIYLCSVCVIVAAQPCSARYYVGAPTLRIQWQKNTVVCVLFDLTSLFSTNGLILALSPQEHFNYYSVDGALGHLVSSLKSTS